MAGNERRIGRENTKTTNHRVIDAQNRRTVEGAQLAGDVRTTAAANEEQAASIYQIREAVERLNRDE